MKKLAKQQVEAEINKRNNVFKTASKAEKRVLIAKDVIEQLNIGTIKAKSGAFVENKYLSSLSYDVRYNPEDKEKNGQVREIILEKNLKCDCCALGGLMVSCTLFNNKEKVSDFRDNFAYLGEAIEDRSVKNGLTSFFSEHQLQLIENAFEKGKGFFNDAFQYEEKKFEKAISFGKKYKSNKNRMIAIMNNIIENKGAFKP